MNAAFINDQQVRFKWADWRMIKDVRKRKSLVEYAPERMRINSLRKNDIIPAEIQVILTSTHFFLFR